MVTTVGNWGGTLSVRLPKKMCEEAHLTNREEVRVSLIGGNIVIEPLKKHKTTKERFAAYSGDYHGETLDWGEDVGGEIC